MIIAKTKAKTGPKMFNFKIVAKLIPAKEEITPTDKDMYPMDGTPVPKP